MATKRKAPAGCFWKGGTLHARTRLKNRQLVRKSLGTDDPTIAKQRRAAWLETLTGPAADTSRTFLAACEGWQSWIAAVRSAGPNTVKRYGVSLNQFKGWRDFPIARIDTKLIRDYAKGRMAHGVSLRTVKRDLVALSSVMKWAVGEGWLDRNHALTVLGDYREKAHVIHLPRHEDIALVIERAPGMIRDMVRVAIATGAREDELLRAKRGDVDHERRQLNLIGKGGKRRCISLDPLEGYRLVSALPPYVGKPWLFWHSDGENYKNFASQFAAIVNRTAMWAKTNGVDFRRFRFHDLRHLHSVEYLKIGRPGYTLFTLQWRLGHASVKTTQDTYCKFLTADEVAFVQGQADTIPEREARQTATR